MGKRKANGEPDLVVDEPPPAAVTEAIIEAKAEAAKKAKKKDPVLIAERLLRKK